ncbi:acyltransferase family protein [Amycolatopsis sp. NPDC024027]|uniref:acyltransferase family protein n=1 Tax=Amycolatopsis sp. NPDC024027 TaxID=3154327 RepID=UPI00340C43FA
MTSTVTARPSVPTAPASTGHKQRDDIQGLRALAVGLVLVYHLRPGWLPGGFVGVDVFFVISGYLIIGTLTGELRRTGRVGLLNFYARRIRRLLPAATVVLLATVAATVLLVPVSRWPEILREVVASALNVQNWVLALFSSDYATATASASPVQHFWSLSVEEQFYLVIPLLLLLSAAIARRSGSRPVAVAFGAITVLTVASLVFSAVYTQINHGQAYFITPTRMWELGIGGLTAMVVRQVRVRFAARLALGWLGLGVVLVSAFTFGTHMAFPGWIALLPTLGTAALLVAGTAERPRVGELSPLLGLPPLRYVGDISYSLYLWHWPVVVFLLEEAGAAKLSKRQVLVAAVSSLVLAALSKHLVEDPLRRPRPRRGDARPRRRAAYALGACMAVVTTVAATVPWQIAQHRLDALRADIALDADHPGALALDPAHALTVREDVPVVPDPSVAAKDIASVWHDGCGQYDPVAFPMKSDKCAYGRAGATKTMVVIGDSHMTQFATALIDIANRAGWRVKFMLHDGCPFSAAAPTKTRDADPSRAEPFAECPAQDKLKIDSMLADKPDLLVTAAMSPESYLNDLSWAWKSPEALTAGYRSYLEKITAAGIPVAVIRDTPRADDNVLNCLQRNPAPHSCDKPRSKAVDAFTDPLATTAATIPGVRVVDLTNWICTADLCPAVVGNVVVYRDNHLTDTYIRTLATPLRQALGI